MNSEREKEGKDLGQSMLEMYETKLNSDVKIVVKYKGESRYFDAHKDILSLKSPIFTEIFHTGTKYIENTITITDVPLRGFDKLLRFIYSNQLQIDSVQDLIEVSKAAQRCKVEGVISTCKAKLEKCQVDINNLCYILEASRYFKMEVIAEKCLQFFGGLSEDTIFHLPGYLNIKHETLLTIIRRKNLSTQAELQMEIRWLICKHYRKRRLLSKLRILAISCDEFLDLIEQFPSFFTDREIGEILCNILRPGLIALPAWCEANSTSSNSEDNCDVRNFLYTYDNIVATATYFQINCNKRFAKSVFLGKDGFKANITFEVKLKNTFPENAHLLMLELAFGSKYVPEKNFQLEIFRNGHNTSIKRKIKFTVKVTDEHYYIILGKQLRLQTTYPHIFNLNLTVRGLRGWCDGDPVSNFKYRVAQIPEDIFCNSELHANGSQSVCLTWLSDWLIFVDPVQEYKSPIFTALYFDESSIK